MTMRKVAQRIPFTPSKTQAALLERCFGDRRFAYNQQVEAFNAYDKETNPNPEYPNVTGMKNANEWLRDSPIPSNALSNAIMDFRKAQSAYFRKAQYEKHRPRFASRNDNIQSFRNTMPIRRMDGNRYPLSKKLGSVRIRKRDRLRYPIENLSSWTVKRENRTYYLVLLFDVDIQPKTRAEGRIGIDLGVKEVPDPVPEPDDARLREARRPPPIRAEPRRDGPCPRHQTRAPACPAAIRGCDWLHAAAFHSLECLSVDFGLAMVVPGHALRLRNGCSPRRL